MRKLQRLFVFFLTITWMLGMSITAYAHDVPQMNQKGTISITMKLDNKAVGGGTLTMYRVGEVHEDNGNVTFRPTGDFVNCGQSFQDVTSSNLPKKLADFAAKNKLSGLTKSIGTDGKVVFSDLEVGLYLFVQNKAASGYNKVNSFLVTMPYMENGTYNYNVDASPKVSIIKPDKHHEKPDPTLPKTGQLNWPIPVLSVSGLLLFAIGWILYFGKRKRNEK